jgi:phosphate/sulfate permease
MLDAERWLLTAKYIVVPISTTRALMVAMAIG